MIEAIGFGFLAGVLLVCFCVVFAEMFGEFNRSASTGKDVK
jgi:hypothetical protein